MEKIMIIEIKTFYDNLINKLSYLTEVKDVKDITKEVEELRKFKTYIDLHHIKFYQQKEMNLC